MAMRMQSEISERVSPELSELIAHVANDPDREEEITLEEVREALERRDAGTDDEFLRAPEQASALEELDQLIEQYGGDVPAIDFIEARASEALSRAIEAALDDPAFGGAPTLGNVRQSFMGGASAELAEEDEYDTTDDTAVVLDELEGLIERFGENAPAENFLGRE